MWLLVGPHGGPWKREVLILFDDELTTLWNPLDSFFCNVLIVSSACSPLFSAPRFLTDLLVWSYCRLYRTPNKKLKGLVYFSADQMSLQGQLQIQRNVISRFSASGHPKWPDSALWRGETIYHKSVCAAAQTSHGRSACSGRLAGVW